MLSHRVVAIDHTVLGHCCSRWCEAVLAREVLGPLPVGQRAQAKAHARLPVFRLLVCVRSILKASLLCSETAN